MSGFRILSGDATPQDLLRERRRDAQVVDALLERCKPTELILKSPDGNKWKITVDNSGTISAALA